MQVQSSAGTGLHISKRAATFGPHVSLGIAALLEPDKLLNQPFWSQLTLRGTFPKARGG